MIYSPSSAKEENPQWRPVSETEFSHETSKFRGHLLRQKGTLRLLILGTVVGILLATLWPFNPFPRNRVDWLRGTNGVKFDTPGLILSKSPLIVVSRSQSCSLELLIQPANTESVHPILEFYDPHGNKGFTVRQWQEGLVVSHHVVDTRGKLTAEKVDLIDVLRPQQPLLLTITSDSNGMVVYFNGDRPRQYPTFVISPGELAGEIVLGTSAENYVPWVGEVRGLAVYSSKLSQDEARRHYDNWTAGRSSASDENTIALYPFSERTGREIRSAIPSAPDLVIPAIFTVPYKKMLKFAVDEFQATWSYFGDLLSNIAGFAPLGFLLCAYLSISKGKKHAFYAILAGAALSFMIEVLQFYIPPRGSGITDVITNTTGTALGALLTQSRLGRRILQMLI